MLNGIQVSKRLWPTQSVTQLYRSLAPSQISSAGTKHVLEVGDEWRMSSFLSLWDMFIRSGLAAFVKSFKCVQICVFKIQTLQNSAVNRVYG